MSFDWIETPILYSPSVSGSSNCGLTKQNRQIWNQTDSDSRSTHYKFILSVSISAFRVPRTLRLHFHFTLQRNTQRRIMAERKSPMVFRLKKTWSKLTAFLRLPLARRRPSRRLRSFGREHRTLGLRTFLEDETIVQNSTVRRLERVSSLNYGRNSEDDVDTRAQVFIDNFRRHLFLERQISLRLRYCRTNSSESEYDERSPSPPCSSIWSMNEFLFEIEVSCCCFVELL